MASIQAIHFRIPRLPIPSSIEPRLESPERRPPLRTVGHTRDVVTVGSVTKRT